MAKTTADYYPIYEELIGFVPPRIQERVTLGLEVDPEILDKVEEIRRVAMYPRCMDTKTAQLILFAVLLSHVSPASEYHARGAMRAGATREELHAVAGLAFLFRGLPAFNLAGEVINKIWPDRPGAAKKAGRRAAAGKKAPAKKAPARRKTK